MRSNMKSSIKKEFGVFWALVLRHLKVFFKNKLTLLFALMVPGITLIIYMVFLRSLELGMVKEFLVSYESLPGYNSIIEASTGLVDSWMFGGLLGVSCISVSLNSCYIIIRDRESGVNRDFISSPISRNTIVISYLVVNILITFIINFVMLAICLALLGGLGNFHLTFVNCLGIIFVMLVSIISASLLTIFITTFIKTEGIFNSIIAIFSAALGFLIGAYMPLKMLPTAASYVCLFFPGTYSVSMFRTFFMEDQINHCFDVMLNNGIARSDAEATINLIRKDFSYNVNFFGNEMNFGWMLLALAIFIVISIILDLNFIQGTTKVIDKAFRRKKK